MFVVTAAAWHQISFHHFRGNTNHLWGKGGCNLIPMATKKGACSHKFNTVIIQRGNFNFPCCCCWRPLTTFTLIIRNIISTLELHRSSSGNSRRVWNKVSVRRRNKRKRRDSQTGAKPWIKDECSRRQRWMISVLVTARRCQHGGVSPVRLDANEQNSLTGPPFCRTTWGDQYHLWASSTEICEGQI